MKQPYSRPGKQPTPKLTFPDTVKFSTVNAEQRGSGVARAVANLSRFEPRLGSNRWSAEP